MFVVVHDIVDDGISVTMIPLSQGTVENLQTLKLHGMDAIESVAS